MEFLITDEMIKKSLVSSGNSTAIANALLKAKSGQDIVVAFLGGSITQCFNASKKEYCYANRTYTWFKDTFKNVNVKYINAGVGATDSIIGAHRMDEQVLSQNPDILFVDFAVNDKDTIYHKIAYESVIRRALSMEKPPAIIEVFMSNFDGSNVQEQQIKIGRNYDLPMISFRDSVFNEIENNRLAWEDVATDEVHPNDYGHFIISQLLINYIEDVYENASVITEVTNKLDNIIYGDKYVNGSIMNNSNIDKLSNCGFLIDNEGFQVFKNGWIFDGKETSNKLELELQGKNIFLLYKKSIKNTSAKIKALVDDKEIIIDTYFENGWGDYAETEVLVEDNKVDKHKIIIEVCKENENSEANILGFLVS